MSNEPFSLFFGNLVGLLCDLERRRDDGLDGCTSDYCAYAVRQLQQYAIHLYQMIATVDGARSEESQGLKDLLEELLVNTVSLSLNCGPNSFVQVYTLIMTSRLMCH